VSLLRSEIEIRLNNTLPSWERVLAHRHWITLKVFGNELHLCARCSGVVLGFLGIKTIALIPLLLLFKDIPLHIGVLFSLLFVSPFIIDWTTQSLGLRHSYNKLRLITGFLEGVGVGLLSLVQATAIVKLVILASFGLSVAFIGFFGRHAVQKQVSIIPNKKS